MGQNGASGAVPTQENEDFVPSSALVPEEDADTLCVDVPGFRKEQMTVQLARKVILKISGRRPVGQKKYQRFHMEFPVSENCDKRKISAKLQNGILYVKQPKLITSAERKDKKLPTEDAPLKKPAGELETMKKNEEQDTSENTTLRDEFTKRDNAENTPAKELVKEESNKTSPKTSEQTETKRPPEKSPTQKYSNSTLENGETTSSRSKQDNAENTPANEPVKEESNKASHITSEQTEAKSLQQKSRTLENGETSTFSKPDELKKDKELQKDNEIKAFQVWKEKAAGGDVPLPKKPAGEPQDQKKAEEHTKREKITSRDEIKMRDNDENAPAKEPDKEKPQTTSPSTSEQTEVESISEKYTSQKYSTSTSEDRKTSSGNKPDELINDATAGAASDMLAKLKTPSKVINMTLVAILILGIGGYVINAMKSSKKSKK